MGMYFVFNIHYLNMLWNV